VTFDSHEEAISLHDELKKNGYKNVIAPTPRVISKCCGVCVMIEEPEIGAVRKYIEENGCPHRSIECIDQVFDPKRDRYA
jgi:hypothetical protein